jgi:hypothetical protein
MPERIQLRRTKGWCKPANAVVVSRPGRFGNPFTVEWAMRRPEIRNDTEAQWLVVGCHADWLTNGEQSRWWTEDMRTLWEWQSSHLHELRGKDVACWCNLSDSCHADTYLRLANKESVRG